MGKRSRQSVTKAWQRNGDKEQSGGEKKESCSMEESLCWFTPAVRSPEETSESLFLRLVESKIHPDSVLF